MSLSKLQETVKDREAWRAAAHGVTKSWPRLGDWTQQEACEIDLIISLLLLRKRQNLPETVSIVQAHHSNYSQG